MIRLLDTIIVGLFGLSLAIILFGGWELFVGPIWLDLSRPDNPFVVGVVLAGLRLWVAPLRPRSCSPLTVVHMAVGSYIAFFTFLTAARHYSFQTHAFDLGVYDQIVWNIANGRGPLSTFYHFPYWPEPVSPDGVNFFGEHLSPILYLVALPYAIFPSPYTLLVVQTIVQALGAYAVYALADTCLKNQTYASIFAIIYLLYPSLHGLNLADFQPLAFAATLLLTGLALYYRGRYVLALGALLLALASREDVAPVLVGLGLWFMLVERRWLVGSVVLVGGVTLFSLETAVIIPSFRNGGPYALYSRFAHLGRTPGEIGMSLLLRPHEMMAAVLTLEKIRYLVGILVPLVFLPLLSPLRGQYNAHMIPFLMLAAIHGFKRLNSRIEERRLPERVGGRKLTTVVLGLVVVLSIGFGARVVNQLKLDRLFSIPRHETARQLLDRIPRDASVSAHYPYVPHLTKRRRVQLFPDAADGEYLFLDLQLRAGRGILKQANGDIRAAAQQQGFDVLSDADGFLLLKRRRSEDS
jgi:uncharacterized membrane protein